jgi:hypothetical protein
VSFQGRQNHPFIPGAAIVSQLEIGGKERASKYWQMMWFQVIHCDGKDDLKFASQNPGVFE